MRTEDRGLAAVAERQLGVFCRADARRAGLTDRQIDDRLARRRWEPVHPEVYRHAGTPLGWHGRAMAATLGLGGVTALSHGAAAAVHGQERVSSDELEITVTTSGIVGREGVVVHRTRALPEVDLDRTRAPYPLTTGERTTIDCVRALAPAQRMALGDDAVSSGAADRARLHERAVALRNGRAGVALLARLTHPGHRRAAAQLAGADGPDRLRTRRAPTRRVEHPAAGRPRLHDRRGRRAVALGAPGGRTRRPALPLLPTQRAADVRRARRVLIEAGVPTLRYSYLDLMERRLEVVSQIRTFLRRQAAA